VILDRPCARVALVTVVALAAWVALVVAGVIFGWTHRSLAPAGDVTKFVDAAKRLIDARNHGNVAFRLIEGGAPAAEYFVSVGDPVGPETLFQVASLSKWITAVAVMTLVESGKVDLDAPVSRYLTRWQLPPGDFPNDGVTVRRLLSHTAGLTDGLGFAGFEPGLELPSLVENLKHPDASPGRTGVIRVGAEPGSQWEYSGGGYLILQLLIEEVTGETFDAYLQRALFGPLGMTRSRFSVDADTPDVATFYDSTGAKAIHYRFTATSAASLYTTVADMTRFVQAHVPGPSGEPVGRGVLKSETLQLMRQPHASLYGADIWGLGPMLLAPADGGEFIIGHDGGNAPAINTAVRLNPTNGDAIVVLESGDPTLATTLAGEWVYWQTGLPDYIMVTMGVRGIVTLVGAGALLIALVGLYFGWRAGRGIAA
jgi:CubicO group peptidase (beta-lactamase class C family)